MLDPKLIRNNPEAVKAGLKKRKSDASLVDRFLAIDEEWRKLTVEVDKLKAQRNSVSDKIGKMKAKKPLDGARGKENADDMIAEMKTVSAKIKELDDEQAKIEVRLNEIAYEMPNLPHMSVPEGINSRDNLEVRSWGKKRKFDFSPQAHDEVAKQLGLFLEMLSLLL